MKAVLGVLSLVVVLGVVYGLAFLGVIPVQKMAAKNPSLAKVLAKIRLAPVKPKGALAAKAGAKPPADPQQQALQNQQKQLAVDRAQLDKDKAAFEAAKQTPTPPPRANGAMTAGAATTPAGDTDAKLKAIYATMSPDDIAVIFAKMPDPIVIQNLMPLDESKAGKILAALPADRAARLSQQMMAQTPTRQASAAAPQPQTNLP